MSDSNKSRFPDSLVLIFGMIVLAQLATYVLPAGLFERVPVPDSHKLRVVPGTYAHVADASRLSWHAALTSIPKGLEAAAEIIFFVFIVGGVIGVIKATGAIDAVIAAAITRLGGRPVLLVAGMTLLFAVGSSAVGMAEEYMPFIPILVTMCIALRMDAIVAMGIVYIGAGVGYGCASVNPFTVMVAQGIAGVEPTSGWWFRALLLVVCVVIGVHHVMRYAGRIRQDPSKSLVGDIDYSDGFHMPEDVEFTPRRSLILAVLVGAVILFVYGVSVRGWYFTELNATFMATALIAAVVAGLGPNRVSREFCTGAAEMTTTALLIGFARTIEVVLNDGQVIDTVIHAMAGPLERLPAELSAIGMLGLQAVCNFFIPSGSGQAYVTMPIMAPLADLVGITKQTAVLAYQMGDGFMNMVVPTNALLMGMLVLGKIPYQRWIRFIAPLMLKFFVVCALALVVAVRIGYQ